MPKCRKRKYVEAELPANKKVATAQGGPVRRNLLNQTYAAVLTLRHYVLRRLPRNSRLRRKKIESIGHGEELTKLEGRLSNFLDSTLVCSSTEVLENDDSTFEQWLSFSQRGDDSHVTLAGDLLDAEGTQSEIVDFVIWLLFSREKKPGSRPKHLLCDGYRKRSKECDPAGNSIQDVYSLFANHNVAALKTEPWPQLLALLGASGQKIMLDLLTESCVFLAVDSGTGNYFQLSGVPLSDIDPSGKSRISCKYRGLSDIPIARSRIFFARPVLTVRGAVQPGYKHTHVLNRYCRAKHVSGPVAGDQNDEGTLKVMMHVFPRQFGIRNVFTSDDTPHLAGQHLQDVAREEEIDKLLQRPSHHVCAAGRAKLPRRLRGKIWDLVKRLQVLHGRCSYTELLRHYCQPNTSRPSQQNDSTSANHMAAKPESEVSLRTVRRDSTTRGSSQDMRSHVLSKDATPSGPIVNMASPHSQVSAFCQAVLSKIVPNDIWGEGRTLQHNKASLLRKVDHFIRLRRFEAMSMHEAAQDFKVIGIPWLQPPGLKNLKTSQSDISKRREVFNEVLYFVFDSLLLPLIRANFYVTESNIDRCQIFYFRHEVWRRIAGSALSTMKNNMFEEMRPKEVDDVLSSRRLGFSQIRLLPKRDKLRPIMNLRRRQLDRSNTKTLKPSINAILGPLHAALKFEKDLNPQKLGSTLTSVSDIYARLKGFKQTIASVRGKKLYFVKMDVQSAFDTIPQDAVVQLMQKVPTQSQYRLAKHVEIQPGERGLVTRAKAGIKSIRRWRSCVLVPGREASFSARLNNEIACNKKHTVFVDGVTHRNHDTQVLLSLLGDHVERNVVKIGKRYYRQKCGIPQGSVLSSLLCNYFYADLERNHLGFLLGTDCLLMRLIDDFLLITLDKGNAMKFVRTMHQGVPDYGVRVNPRKTLVNFDMRIEGEAVCKNPAGQSFPYCGTCINDKTLEITKDVDATRQTAVANTLTIDFGRSTGYNFQRRILNAFKIQSHLMFYDTSHNSVATVLDSLHFAFGQTARKMWAYLRCLPNKQRPGAHLIIETICEVAHVAFSILTSKSRRMRHPEYACSIRRGQVTSIAYEAFLAVLMKYQTNYAPVIKWLRDHGRSSKHVTR